MKLIDGVQEIFYDFYGTMVPGILSLICIFTCFDVYIENYKSIVFIIITLIFSYVLGILLNFIARIVFGYNKTKNIIDALSFKKIIYSLRKEGGTKEIQKTDYKIELQKNEKLIRDYFLQSDSLVKFDILKNKLKRADINSFSTFLLRRYDKSSLLQKYIAKTNLFINLATLFLIIFVKGMINNLFVNNVTAIIKLIFLIIFMVMITKKSKNAKEDENINNETDEQDSDDSKLISDFKDKKISKKPLYIILLFVSFMALDYGYMIFDSISSLRPTVYKRIGFDYFDYIWNLIITSKFNPILLNGYIISYMIFLASEFEYDRHCKLKEEERFLGILDWIKQNEQKIQVDNK